eukprot:CAMPEP_0114607820 /NCGR_PEP_ID=MMETSP0168-20121206/2260_1 /TAXON_ID=95228 ORGANISM="Vannella sp., Strain DIVA3 517/6/12" /NCGR_SAMPLE_ID=MMETSP0168 /ASSEMBLY_ACC=CAM_ASM_000044 /LENGTH=161 /DNA_ID=CAMNT_0001818699 /DNA_START=127 /DNA_END=609 /DNA_ORIENTATION=+
MTIITANISRKTALPSEVNTPMRTSSSLLAPADDAEVLRGERGKATSLLSDTEAEVWVLSGLWELSKPSEALQSSSKVLTLMRAKLQTVQGPLQSAYKTQQPAGGGDLGTSMQVPLAVSHEPIVHSALSASQLEVHVPETATDETTSRQAHMQSTCNDLMA